MIEINLLPEELKIKTKVKTPEQVVVKGGQAILLDKLFIYAIPALFVLLILMHTFFAVSSILRNGQLMALNRKWLSQAAQKKTLEGFNQEFSSSTQDSSLLMQLTRQRVLWSQKLNELSLRLPSGVWFNDIVINSKSITLQGSVISLQKEEVSLINKLLDNLKEDFEFSKDFSTFEVSNVQKRSVGGYDISDFILIGALKPR